MMFEGIAFWVILLVCVQNVQHLGPATDFYKKLALDCSGQQIGVDLFLLSSQYSDLASLGTHTHGWCSFSALICDKVVRRDLFLSSCAACVSKYSAGSVFYYPSFHHIHNTAQGQKFQKDLQRYLTRKIGFEAVMRIRCTKGEGEGTCRLNPILLWLTLPLTSVCRKSQYGLVCEYYSWKRPLL